MTLVYIDGYEKKPGIIGQHYNWQTQYVNWNKNILYPFLLAHALYIMNYSTHA